MNNNKIVLKSFEDLGQFTDHFRESDGPDNERALAPMPVLPSDDDLVSLVEAVQAAAEQLGSLAAENARSREQAVEGLAQLRRLQEARPQLVQVVAQAQRVAQAASELADSGFDEECQDKAKDLSLTATRVADVACFRLAAVESEASQLALRPDVARLLTEEQALEDAAKREAEGK